MRRWIAPTPFVSSAASIGHLALVTTFALVGAACAPARPPIYERPLVDLTWTIDATTVVWPTSPGFTLETQFDGVTEGGYYYLSHVFHGPEHGGTHIDSPIHFYAGRDTTEAIPLERLVGPGVKIDARAQSAADRDHLVGRAEFDAWEAQHGPLPEGAIVLIETGFGERWPDAATYLGTALRGEAGVAALHFPGLDPEVVPWLVEERKIRAIGIDTASIDRGQSKDFASHVALMGRNVPAFENVARLGALPAQGFVVVALPAKIGGGSGGPLRIIAILEP